jgi:hypothetical protein
LRAWCDADAELRIAIYLKQYYNAYRIYPLGARTPVRVLSAEKKYQAESCFAQFTVKPTTSKKAAQAMQLPATFANSFQVLAGHGLVRLSIGESSDGGVTIFFRHALLMTMDTARSMCTTIQETIAKAEAIENAAPKPQ